MPTRMPRVGWHACLLEWASYADGAPVSWLAALSKAFMRTEVAPLTEGQASERDATAAYSFQADDVQAHESAHAPNLAFAPLP